MAFQLSKSGAGEDLGCATILKPELPVAADPLLRGGARASPTEPLSTPVSPPSNCSLEDSRRIRDLGEVLEAGSVPCCVRLTERESPS